MLIEFLIKFASGIYIERKKQNGEERTDEMQEGTKCSSQHHSSRVESCMWATMKDTLPCVLLSEKFFISASLERNVFSTNITFLSELGGRSMPRVPWTRNGKRLSSSKSISRDDWREWELVDVSWDRRENSRYRKRKSRELSLYDALSPYYIFRIKTSSSLIAFYTDARTVYYVHDIQNEYIYIRAKETWMCKL